VAEVPGSNPGAPMMSTATIAGLLPIGVPIAFSVATAIAVL
jgi:hypothetical protein